MFVTNYPAMHLEDYLIISDLHLGITKDIYHAGISLPSQVNDLCERLKKLKKITKAKNLVIVGDVKHNIPNISRQEIKEFPEFFKALKFREVILVKGNHDGNIEKLAKDLKNVSVRKSFSIGDYFLSHGHRKVTTKKENIIIGHNHPGVKMEDRMGAFYILQSWVVGKINLEGRKYNLIIMPAFNPLSGCSIVNKNEFIGPLAKKLKNPDIYLLDGTYLGNIKNLNGKNGV
jgi:uncharacterized protein